MSEDSWEDYESQVLFPGCDCGHDATEHAGWHSDYEGCRLCDCEIEWEHA